MTRLKYNKEKIYCRDIETLSQMTGIDTIFVNGLYQVMHKGQTVLQDNGRSVYYFLLGMNVCKTGEMQNEKNH